MNLCAIQVFDFKVATQLRHPFSHIDKSVSEGFGMVCFKAAAVVFNHYLQLLFYIESHKNMFRSSMFHYVVQCFFNGKIDVSAKLAADKGCRKIISCLYRTANAILSEVIHGVCPGLCQQVK